MDFKPLFAGELRYTSLVALSYEPGGQIYGTMEGEVSGDRLSGHFQLTNLAPMRPDDVNCPTLRGLLITDDGAQAYVEWDGVATLRPSDQARVFVTSLSFRTGDPRYAWLNTVVSVVEGVLDSVTVGGTAKLRAYTSEPTI
jgi:hypothetical protein